MLLTVPRERSSPGWAVGRQWRSLPGGLMSPTGGNLPTVLGRRDQSKNSVKSVPWAGHIEPACCQIAASYNLNPSHPAASTREASRLSEALPAPFCHAPRPPRGYAGAGKTATRRSGAPRWATSIPRRPPGSRTSPCGSGAWASGPCFSCRAVPRRERRGRGGRGRPGRWLCFSALASILLAAARKRSSRMSR